MNRFLSYSILMVLGMALVSSCYYDNQEDLHGDNPGANCDTTAVTYSEDVSKILDIHCVSCHGEISPQSGLDLSEYQEVQNAAQDGRLLDRITRPEGDALLMPPSGKLSSCNIDKIRIWVTNGAINN